MPGKHHARRGLTALAAAFVVLAVTTAPVAAAVGPDTGSGSGTGAGTGSGSVSKAGVSGGAVRPDRRYQMPGYNFRTRDVLAQNASAALTLIMVQDNTQDPVYRAARKLVSDEIAVRMGLDAAQLDRAWSRAPRNHQVAGLAAVTQIGVTYIEGKEDPYVAMDCSGLQWYSWRVAGLDMPRQAVSQQDRHMRIERKDAVWGDIVGEGTHVHMYLGVGLAMIHAPFGGRRVKFKMMSEEQAARSIWADPSDIAKYRL